MHESKKRNHFKTKCSTHPFCGVDYDLIPSKVLDIKSFKVLFLLKRKTH